MSTTSHDVSERPTKRARISNVGDDPNTMSVETPERSLQDVDPAEDEDDGIDRANEQPGELRASDLYLDTVRLPHFLKLPA